MLFCQSWKPPWCSAISEEVAAPGRWWWICVLRWNCDERFFCWADDDGCQARLERMRRARAGRLVAGSMSEKSCKMRSIAGSRLDAGGELVAACRGCRSCWLLAVVGWWLEVSLARPWSASAEKKGRTSAGSVKAQRERVCFRLVSLPRLVAVQAGGAWRRVLID